MPTVLQCAGRGHDFEAGSSHNCDQPQAAELVMYLDRLADMDDCKLVRWTRLLRWCQVCFRGSRGGFPGDVLRVSHPDR